MVGDRTVWRSLGREQNHGGYDRPQGMVAVGPDREPPETAQRYVSIVDVTSPPEDAPLDLSVSVVDPWITLESTAMLEATVTNEGTKMGAFTPAFHKSSSAECGTPGILLYSTRSGEFRSCPVPVDEYLPSCLVDGEEALVHTSPRTGNVSWTMEGISPKRLAPGETSTDLVVVTDDPTVDGCLEEGRYEFEEQRRLEPLPGDWQGGDACRSDWETFVWTFAVVVEDVSG